MLSWTGEPYPCPIGCLQTTLPILPHLCVQGIGSSAPQARRRVPLPRMGYQTQVNSGTSQKDPEAASGQKPFSVNTGSSSELLSFAFPRDRGGGAPLTLQGDVTTGCPDSRLANCAKGAHSG